MKIVQSCPTLCGPMDCSLPGSSVHGIFQAIVLEWIAISFSRDLPDQGSNPGLPHCRQMLNCLSHQGSPSAANCRASLSHFPQRLSHFVATLSTKFSGTFPHSAWEEESVCVSTPVHLLCYSPYSVLSLNALIPSHLYIPSLFILDVLPGQLDFIHS